MIEVRSNGVKMTGWTSVSIRKSIDQICNLLQLSVSWDSLQTFPLLTQDLLEVYYKNVKVFTGYVDELRGESTNSSHKFSIAARSKASDLVDCTAIVKNAVFYDQDPIQICTTLCDPFGISVISSAQVGKIKTITTANDSCYHVIDRACRMRGLLAQQNENGDIEIGEVGTEQHETHLIYGQNIKQSSCRISSSQRFRDYTVQGSQKSQQSTAQDTAINRHRPIVINADNTEMVMQDRAQFEANVRKARATVYECEVQGWGVDGDPWKPNKLVKVYDPNYFIDEVMLIQQANLSYNNNGTTTKLTLVPKDSFTVKKIQDEARKTETATPKEWAIQWK